MALEAASRACAWPFPSPGPGAAYSIGGCFAVDLGGSEELHLHLHGFLVRLPAHFLPPQPGSCRTSLDCQLESSCIRLDPFYM